MKIAIFDSVDKLPPACLDLMNKAGKTCFFSGPDWYRCLERHGLAPAQRPRFYVALAADDTPLALLPMIEDTGGSWAKPRVLKSFSNFYTMDFAPVLGGVQDEAALAFLARSLLAERPAFDVIDIRMLTEGTATADDLQAAFARTGAASDRFFMFDNWIHPVAGQSSADYYNDRPSRLKNTIRRKRKKFEEAHALSTLVVSDGDDLDKAIADYQLIYAKSWKEDESFPDFIPALMRASARAGVLRLGVIYADGTPAAAQLWMIYSGTAMIYKLAYDEDYSALSAGSILSKHMMDQAIDVDKVEILDYGVGNDAYKRDWMTIRRQKCGILVFNKTLRGLAAAGRHFMGRKIRRLLGDGKAVVADTEMVATAE